MGIRWLASHLKPYAGQHALSTLEGYSAIIDGPSLVHYAHKLASATSTGPPKIPSYTDINDEAIRWLHSLEAANIKVSIILFDGALPQSKRPVRLSRLEERIKQMRNLRAFYPAATCPMCTCLGSGLHAFPAPALREALVESSSFATRTQVVPGEADDWCALYAKDEARSIIFTSDTDLLLYNYAPETLVVFLRDLDISAGIKTYSPDQIRQTLQIKSLVSFGFAVLQWPYNTAYELIQKARSVDLGSDEYLDFSRRYTADAVEPTYLSSTSGPPVILPDMDVRVSEFVHQALDGSSNPTVYLPMLVEDPNEASAWYMGQDIRVLAYSLLAPQQANVLEYKRKAQSLSVDDIDVHPSASLTVLVTKLEQQISPLMTWGTSNAIEADLLWLLIAVSVVLANIKAPPPVNQVMRVLNGDFDHTWTFIQLTARIQAALYSLRMMKQVTRVWLAVNEKADTKPYQCLSRLDEHMNNFPSIAAVFTVPGQRVGKLRGYDKIKGFVEEIYTSVGIKIPQKQIPQKETSDRRKMTKHAREVDRKKRMAEKKRLLQPEVSNPFTVLDDEQD